MELRVCLPPLEGWVGVEVAAEVAGKQKGLGVEEQADGDRFAEKRVLDFLLLALLPRGEDFLAAVVGEEHGSAFVGAKMLGTDLLAVDEREGEAVSEGRAKLLHEVEGEAIAAGAVAMEVADGGIESMCGEGAGGVETEKGVEVGEQRVEGIARWPAVAVAEGERVALLSDEVAEDREVLGGSFAFESADGVDGLGGAQCSETVGEGIGGGVDGGGIGGVFAGGAPEDVAAVGDLAGDEGAGEGGAGCGIIGAPVLFAAEEDVAAGGADDIGEVATVLGEEGNGDTGLGTGPEKEGAGEDVAETDDAAEVEVGQAESDFLFDGDHDGLALLAKVGALGGDVECVEEAAHAWLSR